MTARPLDVIVIGAGPYGLAAAAHLRGSGKNLHVFGEPMSFWKEHMPRGMLLRSPWSASNISSPRSAQSLDVFERQLGARIARPIPLTDFIAYGSWFQQQVAPDLDPRRVRRVDATQDGFRVLLEDGESLESRHVVVAGGIKSFAWRPPEFDGLSPELVSHSNEHVDLARFAHLRVGVIGGGQSALESAVLLREAGADVEVMMRSRQLRWMGRATRDGLVGRILFDPTDVGPGVVSHLIARPMLWKHLPPFLQRSTTRSALAAGVAVWLKRRMEGLNVDFGRRVVGARSQNGQVVLRVDDGSSRAFDHVLLGTGYRVDVRRYDFLAPELVSQVACVAGYPVLDRGFQSSVRGLHFLGAPAVYSFGALVRFVSGTDFAARALDRWLMPGVREATGHDRADRGFAVGSRERRAQ
jgi:hypothetical protein